MMRGVWSLAVLWLLYIGIDAQNRSRSRVQGKPEVQSNKRSPVRPWNSQMYPIWKGSDAQKRDCWKGGQVSFSLQNDAPTLTGAKVTFFIQLNFPRNQTVLPDGQVVWNQNRTNNGTWAPVYPDEGTEGSECTFPDGSPFPRDSEKRRSKFVYVWKAWGKYWQVVDGPSSNLTVATDGIPLGSYTMEVVVYHYRGRQKFIPIGSTTSQFTITDQVPISVSISQVLDLDQDDLRFIQNRAVSFSVAVHDPSNYLQAADISFSWDFGDQSGMFITRNTAVTHTYVTPGVFNAKVVVQAAIPITPCGSTAVMTTAQVVASTALPTEPSTGAAAATTAGSQTVEPSTAAVPGNATLLDTDTILITVSSLNEEVNVEAEDGVIATAVPENAQSLPAEEAASAVVAPEDMAVNQDVVAVTQTEAVVTEEGAEGIQEVIPSEEAVPSDAAPNQPEENATQVSEGTEAAAQVVTSAVPGQAATEVVSNEVGTATQTNGQVLLLAKRQVPEGPLVGCLLYRYGTFAANLDVVSGIESVQIVQVEPVVSAGLENTVDLTVTCQGSVPREACTVISGPDCDNPQQTVCSPVEPSDCQLVLRQAFNETGVFCVNVSLADNVSLAVASTQVRVSAGAASSVNGMAVTVGVLLAALAVAGVAYTYRHVKSYTPLRNDHAANWFPDRQSLWLFFQNALGRSASGENSPLLNGRVV